MLIPNTSPETLIPFVPTGLASDKFYLPPVTEPEKLRPKNTFIVAFLGLTKQISEIRNPFSIKKLGLAFLVAATFINANSAVANAPAVPIEPLRVTASYSLGQIETVVLPPQPPDIASIPITKEQAFINRLPERINTLKKFYSLDGHPDLKKELIDIASAESDFDTNAKSSKDAFGTMQSTVLAAKDMVLFLEKKMGSKNAWDFLRGTYGVNTASDVNDGTLKTNKKFNEAVGDFYYQKCFDYVLGKIPGTSGWERVKLTKLCYFIGTGNFKELDEFAKPYLSADAPTVTVTQLLAFGKLDKFTERQKVTGWSQALARYESR